MYGTRKDGSRIRFSHSCIASDNVHTISLSLRAFGVPASAYLRGIFDAHCESLQSHDGPGGICGRRDKHPTVTCQ